MKKMTTAAMMQANGGASKYVYCPTCGYKYKTSWWERLIRSNSYIRAHLNGTHGLLKNIGNNSKSVHK